MLKVFKKFEDWVIIVLGCILGIFILVAVFELGYLIITEVFSRNTSGQGVLLNLSEIKKFLDLFFIVLIAFELFETVRVYLKDNVFHAEYIVLVGVIALARKIVLLDFEKVEPLTLVGLAALVISLTVGYFFLKKGEIINKE
jgi:uncharacterized membrane protein (DUF373 family)